MDKEQNTGEVDALREEKDQLKAARVYDLVHWIRMDGPCGGSRCHYCPFKDDAHPIGGREARAWLEAHPEPEAVKT